MQIFKRSFKYLNVLLDFDGTVTHKSKVLYLILNCEDMVDIYNDRVQKKQPMADVLQSRCS